MMKAVAGRTCRFTVITDSLLRIEEDMSGQFENRPTQTVVNRDFASPKVQVLRDNNQHEIEIETDSFHLYYDGGRLNSESLYIDLKKGHATYGNRWYFGADNDSHRQNLGGTIRTLDKIDGATDLGKGIMSKDGYSYLDDSKSFIYQTKTDSFTKRESETVDGYLFCYGRDYQKSLSDFYQLTGPTPLLPRYALGNWWSRFYQYTQTSYQELMEKFAQKDVPINVCVLDMDWHKFDIPQKYGSGWTGYSWNKELFPEPEKLLKWLHENGEKVTLNVHPAAGIRAFEDNYQKACATMGMDPKKGEPISFDLENPKFRKAYFEDIHHQLEHQGVDFWWIDWQQGLAKSENKMDPLWLLNHYHYQDNNRRTNGNGLILSRYAGPGSHRYPLGFSGDTVISWKSLNFQPQFTITAANIGYTWWSHDIGGHMHGSFDGELATRWLQLGVFSPINRLHSSNNLFSGKEPWNYRLDYEKSQEKFLRLRTKLVPYLDSANYQTHVAGIPIVKPLYYDFPKNDNAYAIKNEYFFGAQMLVSPITQPHDKTTQMSHATTWLPEGKWIDYFTHLPYNGATVIKNYRDIDKMPVFVKKGAIIVTNPDSMANINDLPEKLEVEIFSGANGKFELFEHQGKKIARTKFTWDDQEQKLSIVVEDPEHIVPEKRTIQKVIYKDNPEQIFSEMRFRIQRAKIEFDLKQKLYDSFTAKNYNYSQFINLLNTLDDDNLRSSLSEVAFIRESF
ncbi:TIM-barrel domain-containing protein [Companilactobacillus halodurans]